MDGGNSLVISKNDVLRRYPDWMYEETPADSGEIYIRSPDLMLGLQMWHFALAMVIILAIVFGWLYWLRVRRRRNLGKLLHDGTGPQAATASQPPPTQQQAQRTYYYSPEGLAPPIGFVAVPLPAQPNAPPTSSDPPPPYPYTSLPAFTPDAARQAHSYPPEAPEKSPLM